MRSGRRAPLSTITRPPSASDLGRCLSSSPPHALGESIRGVDEDEVEGRAPRPGSAQPSGASDADELYPLGEPEALDVPERRPDVVVDQGRHGRRPARAPRSRAPGSAVEVEHRGASDVAERREDRLAHPVRRRPDAPASWRARSRRPFSSPATMRMDQSRYRVARRRSDGGRPPSQAQLRDVERAVPLEQRQHLAASREQGRRILGQLGDEQTGAGHAGGCRGSPPRRAG